MLSETIKVTIEYNPETDDFKVYSYRRMGDPKFVDGYQASERAKAMMHELLFEVEDHRRELRKERVK